MKTLFSRYLCTVIARMVVLAGCMTLLLETSVFLGKIGNSYAVPDNPSPSMPTERNISEGSWAQAGAKFHTLDDVACSVGFPATDNEGNHYFLTSLHCFVHHSKIVPSSVFIHNPSSDEWDLPVGKLYKYTGTSSAGTLDIALVKMFPSTTVPGGFSHVPSRVSQVPAHGTPVCAVGYRQEHMQCGSIGIERTTRYNELLSARSPAFTADVCVLSGDSGGPVWTTHPSPKAIGIIQASNAIDHCTTQPIAWFSPLADVLTAFSQSVPGLRLA